jgi:hypothetical protein
MLLFTVHVNGLNSEPDLAGDLIYTVIVKANDTVEVLKIVSSRGVEVFDHSV